MPRFADHRTFVIFAQQREKDAHRPRLESERWRELYHQWPEAPANPSGTTQEFLQRLPNGAQTLLVSDLLGHLDRKPKSTRGLCGPSRVGIAAVVAIEGRVDFHAAQHPSIAAQVRAFPSECGRACLWNG